MRLYCNACHTCPSFCTIFRKFAVLSTILKATLTLRHVWRTLLRLQHFDGTSKSHGVAGDAELVGDPLGETSSPGGASPSDDFFGGSSAQPTSSEDFFANGIAASAAEAGRNDSGDATEADGGHNVAASGDGTEAPNAEAAAASEGQTGQQYSLEEVMHADIPLEALLCWLESDQDMKSSMS